MAPRQKLQTKQSKQKKASSGKARPLLLTLLLAGLAAGGGYTLYQQQFMPVDQGDYLQLPGKGSRQPVVQIYFSYQCDSCYSSLASLHNTLSRLPSSYRVEWHPVPREDYGYRRDLALLNATAVSEHLQVNQELLSQLLEMVIRDQKVATPEDVVVRMDNWLLRKGYQQNFERFELDSDVRKIISRMKTNAKSVDAKRVLEEPVIRVNERFELKTAVLDQPKILLQLVRSLAAS